MFTAKQLIDQVVEGALRLDAEEIPNRASASNRGMKKVVSVSGYNGKLSDFLAEMENEMGGSKDLLKDLALYIGDDLVEEALRFIAKDYNFSWYPAKK